MSCYCYLILVLFSLNGINAQLQVNPNGTVFTRSIRDSVVFTCFLHVDMIDVLVNIQWLDSSGIEIQDKTPGRDNTPYIDKSQPLTNKLHITNIQKKHAGDYYCSAIVGGNLQQIRVTLNLFGCETFFAPTPQNPIAFSIDALIQCRVSCNPIPTVYWRFRGQRIMTGDRYHQDQFGLRVKNITRADNGLYYCCAEVESTGYYKEEMIDVIVDYAPKITRGPGLTDGIQSQQYTLTCLAEGHPDPKYEFFKDDNAAPVFSTQRIQVDGDLGAINFRPLHAEDAGNYKCHAFNRAGEDFKTGRLRVLVPPTIYNIKNTTAVEGGSTTLVCLSYGDPPPDMTYRKAGKSEDYQMGSNEGGRIVLSNPMSGQLNMVINNLLPEDMANYSCKAHNVAGYHDKNGSITVQFSPRFHPSSTTTVYNWAGKTRNLTCKVLAEPMPLIEWVRDNRVIQNNETYRTYVMSKDSNLQVTVREVDQGYIYGNFTCRARNQMGTGTFNVEMRRARLPGPPARASYVATPTTIELSIDLPKENGGVEVLGFSVQYDLLIAEFYIGDVYLLEHLYAEHRYNLQIRARSEVGLGDPLPLMVTTPPPTPPKQLVITSDQDAMSPYEYIVTWEKPLTGGLPVDEYRFRLRRVTVKPGTFQVDEALEQWSQRVAQDDYQRPMLYYVLGNLNPSTYYQLVVQAMNAAGWSPETGEFVFLTAPGDDPPDEGFTSTEIFPHTWIIIISVLLCILIIGVLLCTFWFLCVRKRVKRTSE